MKTLYKNATVITMDENDNQFNSILIEDNKILEVGNDIVDSEATVIDLHEQTVLPGFIDGHSHFALASQFASFPSLANPPVGDVNTIDDIVRIMTKQADEAIKNGDKLIFAIGYDHELLKEHRHPNKFDLDKVSTEIGVMAIHASAHVGGVNSKVLEMLGIDENTPNPAGGVIGRVEGSSEPNGYLEENAFIPNFFKLLPDPTDEVLGKYAEAGVKLYASNGITTVQDGFPSDPDFLFYKAATKSNKIPFDVYAYPGAIDKNKWDDGTWGIKLGEKEGNMKFAGEKIFTDGSPQARTAWLSKPYEVVNEGDDPTYRGYGRYTDEQVINAIKHITSENGQFLTHVNGDAGLDQLLNCYEEAMKTVKPTRDIRPVSIHTQIAREDQFPRLKELGFIPSFFISHVYYWGDVHVKNLGEERAQNISWIKKAIENDMIFTCHEDTPVVPPRILFSIWAGVNRITRSGRVLGEENRIGVYDMLKAYTRYGAYVYFEEDRIGTLEVGKDADLVILQENPLTVDPMKIKDITVAETIKAGKTIFKI